MRIHRLLICISAAMLVQAVVPNRTQAFQFAMVGQSVRFSEESFDKSNFDQLTIVSARRKCDDKLEAALSLVEHATDLTPTQKRKLKLAGEIDIHRFFHRYRLAKKGLTFGTIARDAWQAEFAAARKKIEPYKQQFADGLHGDSSLFMQTMVTALDSDQFTSVTAMFEDRSRTTYTYHLQMAYAIIDRKVPLTASQRTTITELMLSRTTPPKWFSNDKAAVFQALSRMEEVEDELIGLFTKDEMDVIRQLIQLGKTIATRQVIP